MQGIMALRDDKLLGVLAHPAAFQTLRQQEFLSQQAQYDSTHDPDHS